MKITLKELQTVSDKINSIDGMDKLIESYEIGNFPNSHDVKDLNVRFRFDIYHGLNLRDCLKKDTGGQVIYNDDHIYTMLRKCVPAITRKF